MAWNQKTKGVGSPNEGGGVTSYGVLHHMEKKVNLLVTVVTPVTVVTGRTQKSGDHSWKLVTLDAWRDSKLFLGGGARVGLSGG